MSLSFALPSSTSSLGSSDSGGGIETDLILAAELGQALLEKNEELAASLEQRERELEVRMKLLGKSVCANFRTLLRNILRCILVNLCHQSQFSHHT